MKNRLIVIGRQSGKFTRILEEIIIEGRALVIVDYDESSQCEFTVEMLTNLLAKMNDEQSHQHAAITDQLSHGCFRDLHYPPVEPNEYYTQPVDNHCSSHQHAKKRRGKQKRTFNSPFAIGRNR